VGDESKEFMRYKRQREQQEKQEEELFTRAPVTKRDKQIEKQMQRQMHGYVINFRLYKSLSRI
jgi:U3 small nucleolar ribonucleoprotein protein LCP5